MDGRWAVENKLMVTADAAAGVVEARVDLTAGTGRVFRALTTAEICDWWVRPGVFDTREWQGDVRVGGRWQSAGIGMAGPYRMGGDFIEIVAPHRLVHGWTVIGAPGGTSTVSYDLAPIPGGTRLTLRHDGLRVPEICTNTARGWETSLARLAELLRG